MKYCKKMDFHEKGNKKCFHDLSLNKEKTH